METKYLNEYNMRQSSIYELRNIAREVGVNSPTTLKKEELIVKVLNILNGTEKPQMPKSKQGRPPKRPLNALNEEEDNILEDSKDSLFNYNISDFNKDREDKLSLLSSDKELLDEIDYSDINPINEVATGYYFIVDDGNGFIFEPIHPADCNNVILVTKNVAEKFSLKNGDYVKCEYRRLLTTESKFLTDVFEINGVKFNSLKTKRLDFDFLPSSGSGDRNIFLFNNNQDYISFYSKTLNCIDKNEKTKILNLNLTILPENKNLFVNNTNVENFFTLIGETTKQNSFTINLFLERIKRLAELEYNVYVFVGDINKLVKYKNFEMGYSFNDIKDKSLDYFYMFLRVANKFKENSVSLFMGLKNNVKDGIYNYLLSEAQEYKCNLIETKL